MLKTSVFRPPSRSTSDIISDKSRRFGRDGLLLSVKRILELDENINSMTRSM